MGDATTVTHNAGDTGFSSTCYLETDTSIVQDSDVTMLWVDPEGNTVTPDDSEK